MKRLIIVCLLLCASLSAHDLSCPLSLSELVDIALENNPKTKQSWWNAKRAAAALGSSKSGYYPKIDLNLHGDQGRDFQFIEGPDVTYTNAGANLVLYWMLFDFGETDAGVCMAAQGLMAANWNSDWVMQGVVVNVLDNALNTLHREEMLWAAEISLEDAKNVYESAREMNEAGMKSVTDLYESEAQLLQMEMLLAEERALLNIQKGRLAASLGYSADCDFAVAKISEVPESEERSVQELICLAQSQRADLMVKQAHINEKYYQEKKVRSSHWPKLSFAGRGGYNRYFKDNSNGAQYQAVLNLDIPLFEGFNTIYQNRMAHADLEISMEELAQLELDMALEVLTYSENLKLAQETIGLAEARIGFAEKSYDGAMEKYRVGKLSIFDLSNAQKALADARVRYSDVKTRLLVSMANLAYATGTLCTDHSF